jgi:hypothetical protein
MTMIRERRPLRRHGVRRSGYSGGGWGTVAYPPANVVRIETSAAVSATTSFFLIEVAGLARPTPARTTQ